MKISELKDLIDQLNLRLCELETIVHMQDEAIADLEEAVFPSVLDN